MTLIGTVDLAEFVISSSAGFLGGLTAIGFQQYGLPWLQRSFYSGSQFTSKRSQTRSSMSQKDSRESQSRQPPTSSDRDS
jgi:hypothetical protein